MSVDFASFKSGDPARSMFRKLGFIDFLEAATSWRMLRSLIVDFNDNRERGAFVDAAKRCVCSSGERILLHAILYATDFAWLADELAGDRTWQSMDSVGGAFREAVAACILQSDRRRNASEEAA